MEANSQAMREAMDKIARCMDEILVRTELDSFIHRKALEAQNLADAVLMEPPRQCDVGTAEEQSQRFREACKERHGNCSAGCPYRDPFHSCELKWAQTPYEEGGLT